MILFEMNTRIQRRPLDRIAEAEIDRLKALGFDWIWLMGVWRIGAKSVEISRQFAPDFEGSPYAIAAYEVSPELGGEAALATFVERAHARGVSVMVDFVPNHMAVDSPLIDAHPEYVIHSNPSLRPESPGDYFQHGPYRLAHGKDPYFAGWTDTVQLDYAHPALRAHQIAELVRIASMVDGVRCDMAMLVLREYVKKHWFPWVDQGMFDHHFPREFWSDAIAAVRARRPDFVFMAEVYWDREPTLQDLGFDLTYDKKFYDLLSHANIDAVSDYLSHAEPARLARSVHFIENHDEERAAVRFAGRSRAAAMLTCAIPGAILIHEGQMEGRAEKLPVQRIRPLTAEMPDERLQPFYAKLIRLIGDRVFREGELRSLGVQRGVVLALARHAGRLVLIGADPSGNHRARSPRIDLNPDRLHLAGAAIEARDLWTGAKIEVDGEPGQLGIAEGSIPSWLDNQAFLLELSSKTP